ncbi:MAG: S-layer homology domain-containing protein [Eubacteriales bacterium]|nr:S-layer homology domain-containing protein [Eubacteriales bacterium]
MKKTLILFVTSLIIINSFSFAVNADRLYKNYNNTVDVASELFVYLNVFTQKPNEEQLTSDVTRIQFAHYIAKILNCYNLELTDKQFFYDINDVAVNNLASFGIFQGNENNMFYPDEYISLQDAIVALLRVTGYAKIAGANKNIEVDYWKTAKDIGLLSNLNSQQNVTLYNAIVLLYNAVHVKIAEEIGYIVSLDEMYSRVEKSEETLLSMIYDMYYLEGIVTANEFTGIYGVEKNSSSKITVDSETYSCKIRNAYKYIGQNIWGYYKSNDEYDIGEIVILHTDNKTNNTLRIYAPDIVSFSNNKLAYYHNGVKAEVFLPRSTQFIYNGVAVTGDADYLFDFETGYVELYENKRSGNYEVACIWAIENVEVAVANLEDYIIYTNRSDEFKQIRLNQDHTKHKIFSAANGESLAIMNLTQGSLISVIRSLDESYLEIYLCSKKITGIVETVTFDDRSVVVDGVEYDISPQYISGFDIRIGESYDFYFDYMGEIAKCVIVNDEKLMIGYVYGMGRTKGLGSTLQFKLFNTQGRHLSLDLAQRAVVNGESMSSKELEAKFTDPITKKLTRQMIRYEVNSNGEINFIETASSSTGGGVLRRVLERGTYNYDINNVCLNNLYPVDSTTKIMILPSDRISNPVEDQFKILNFERLEYTLQLGYMTEGFKIDESTGQLDLIALYADSLKYPVVPTLMVVDKVVKVIGHDGLNTSMLYGYVSGGLVSIRCDSSVNVENLRKGDVIRYATNNVNEIGLMSIILKYDDPRTWGLNITKDISGSNITYLACAFGDVMGVELSENGNEVVIRIGENGVEKENLTFDKTKVPLVVIESNKDIRMGTVGDLREASSGEQSKIFVQKMYNKIGQIKILALYR